LDVPLIESTHQLPFSLNTRPVISLNTIFSLPVGRYAELYNRYAFNATDPDADT